MASKKKGRCGRPSKLTPELRAMYLQIGQEYADLWLRLTVRLFQSELETRGEHLSVSTISQHMKQLKMKETNLRIKPALTPDHKTARMRFILNQANREHGLNRPGARNPEF